MADLESFAYRSKRAEIGAVVGGLFAVFRVSFERTKRFIIYQAIRDRTESHVEKLNNGFKWRMRLTWNIDVFTSKIDEEDNWI